MSDATNCRSPDPIDSIDELHVTQARLDERTKNNTKRLNRIGRKINVVLGVTVSSLITMLGTLLTLLLS
jgi:hypothetical protein